MSHPPDTAGPAQPAATTLPFSSGGIGRNALIKFTSEIIGRIAAFLLVLYAARALGETAFGLYNVGLAWGFVLAQLADLGLQLIISREVAVRGRAARPDVILALQLKLALSVVVLALLAAVSARSDPAVRLALFTAGLMPLANTYLEFATYIFRGQQRILVEARILAAARVATAVLGFVALWLGGGLMGLTLTNLLGVGLFALWALWQLAREGWLSPGRPAPVRGARLHLLRQALPLGIAIFLSIAYTRLAVFLLEAQLGAVAVAHFSAAYRLVEPAQIVPASLLAAVFPAYSLALHAEPARATRLALRTAVLLAALGAVVAIGFWLLAPWLIPLLYGSAYTPGIPVLQLLGLTAVFTFVNYALTHFLVARSQQSYITLFTAGMLILHTGLSWLLIPRLGILGPAVSVLIVEALLTLACVLALNATRNAVRALQA